MRPVECRGEGAQLGCLGLSLSYDICLLCDLGCPTQCFHSQSPYLQGGCTSRFIVVSTFEYNN